MKRRLAVKILAGSLAVVSNHTFRFPRFTRPNSPTNVKAVVQGGQVIVSFNPSSNNGGEPVTEYTVVAHKLA